MTTRTWRLAGALAAAGLSASCTHIDVRGTGGAPDARAGAKVAPAGYEAVSARRCLGSRCEHQVIVHVTGTTCRLTVEPEVMLLKKGEADIVWELVAPKDFRFVPGTGFDFKLYPSSKELVGKQFGAISIKDRVVTVRSRYTDPVLAGRAYFYNLRVTGPASCELDPPLINDM